MVPGTLFLFLNASKPRRKFGARHPVVFVSAYDSYLTVMYVDSLQSLELNPVGRYMMGLDDPLTGCTPHIAVFLGCKFAGTILVLFVLQLLWVWRRQLSSMVAMKVAFAQTLLAFMLLFGGHKW